MYGFALTGPLDELGPPAAASQAVPVPLDQLTAEDFQALQDFQERVATGTASLLSL
jgi:hypothetical protein